jgi:hypothetical protein
LNHKRICADDIGVLDSIDRAVWEKHGGDRKSNNIKVAISNLDRKPTGTTRQRSLRKLRKDSPTLHAEVLAGKLSPQSKKGDTRKHRPFWLKRFEWPHARLNCSSLPTRAPGELLKPYGSGSLHLVS